MPAACDVCTAIVILAMQAIRTYSCQKRFVPGQVRENCLLLHVVFVKFDDCACVCRSACRHRSLCSGANPVPGAACLQDMKQNRRHYMLLAKLISNSQEDMAWRRAARNRNRRLSAALIQSYYLHRVPSGFATFIELDDTTATHKSIIHHVMRNEFTSIKLHNKHKWLKQDYTGHTSCRLLCVAVSTRKMWSCFICCDIITQSRS